MLKDEPLYDLSAIKSLSKGNDLFVHRMVKVFCDYTPGMLTELKIAYGENDMEKLAAAAHKIKPSIDNLNINALKYIIREIENARKEQVESARLAEILAETDNVMMMVMDKMKQEYPVE